MIYESVKGLKIELFMQSKLVFANNAILSCLFFFFLIIDLYFLIIANIVQIFNSTVELITYLEISTKETKAEMKVHTGTTKTKVKKCSIVTSSCTNLFVLISQSFILVYFFYFFQSKFLTYIFLSHINKVIIYF